MSGIFQFFTTLLAKIAAFAEWIILLVKRVFLDLWNIITDLFCWLLESALSLAAGALSTISIPFDPQHYYAMIPPDTANMLGVIGITQALSIVVASLLIRFFLQTIPFVRWGS